MYTIRPVHEEDENGLSLLIASGGIGITTLPHQPELLRLKIEHSLKSFQTNVTSPNDEKYFFVLENLESHEIGGCCAIYAQTGVTETDDYYKVQFEPTEQYLENQPAELKVLTLTRYHNGPSMLCSLYLSQKFRKEGLGRLLSLSRLMFIACHPKRFTKTIIANIRGVFDENGVSPFWEGLGRHFLDVDFETVLKMQEIDKQFIRHILPKHPIYTCLLPQTAQETIGKVHIHSGPALSMLEKEGFAITDEIDLFDAGPKLMAELSSIRTFKERKAGHIAQIGRPAATEMKLIISNNHLDFRACYGHIEVQDTGAIRIDSSVTSALNVDIGDEIYFISAH